MTAHIENVYVLWELATPNFDVFFFLENLEKLKIWKAPLYFGKISSL